MLPVWGTEPEPGGSRGAEIRQRIAAVRARIDELHQGDAPGKAPGERIAAAQRHVAASRAAAERALAASVRAFRRSAEAHERAAIAHEQAAATGSGDKDEHKRRAAFHRAAAAASRQRAERAQWRLPGEQAVRAPGI
jgi:predicted pyridoxine 5'-phosphate oxidase superfamily flavin-nucleotide-binding protein